jgi:hypothetical protein
MSAQVRVDGLEQFVEHGFGFGFLAAAEGFGGAVVEMIAHQISGDAAESFLHAGDLGDDVGAVAIFFDHFLEAADLAFDAAEALEVRGFELGIDADRFTRFGAEGAGAVGAGDVLRRGVRGGNFGSQWIPPRAIYTPQGYWMSNRGERCI